MQNLEYKAELRDLPLARAAVRALGAAWIGTLHQTDTYYRVPDAKLKKRECEGLATEWIFYSRGSRLRPKLSTFTIYSDEQARERFGERPAPVWLVVKKARELYVWKGVRIHLDSVENLGLFVEFEAMIGSDRTLEQCHALLQSLRGALGPALGEAIACGYADLLDGERVPEGQRARLPESE